MNKQELINELNLARDSYSNEDSFRSGVRTGLGIAIGVIKKLDEPERIVVPKFIAEWYEKAKKDLEYEIYAISNHISNRDYSTLTEMEVWFIDNSNKPIETLIKMKLFGYEVEKEKEKLYYVLDKQGKTLLVLMGGEVSISGGYVLSESTANKDIYQLTEKQIKDYDERFWQFAVEVAE